MSICGPCGNVLCSQYGCMKQRTRQPEYAPVFHPVFGPPPGCICPPTSEQTCQNPTCPRKARTNTALEGTKGFKAGREYAAAAIRALKGKQCE